MHDCLEPFGEALVDIIVLDLCHVATLTRRRASAIPVADRENGRTARSSRRGGDDRHACHAPRRRKDPDQMRTLTRIPIDAIRAGLHGSAITPDDPGYDDARRVF